MEGDLSWPLERAVRLHPRKTAVVDGQRSVSYEELHLRVRALGEGLKRLEAGPGERIGYLGVNSLPHFECVLGVPAHGRVLADLNFRLTPEELAFMVDDAEVRVLVVDPTNLEVGRELLGRCRSLRRLVLAGPSDEPDCVPYEELLAGQPAGWAEVEADALATISYTGGTTGLPKGVMLSHGNLLANAKHNLIATGHCERDTFVHVCPMFHAAGVANIFATTWAGAGHAIVPRFEPVAVADAIETNRATLTLLVPTMIGVFLDYLAETPRPISSLRNLQYSASPISPELQRRTVEALDCEVAQFYGMTEAAPTVTHLSPSDHAMGIAGREPQRTRLASVGVPVPGVEAEVRRGNGDLADIGEVGEIWVRGPNVMLGYWNRPEATEEAMVDGWYRSGDAGYADRDGYLYLVDRIKDMIVSGGENVYSVEVERALLTHPAVREAAVFGVPDSHWGERVHAVVVLDPALGHEVPEADALEALCREQIAGFKVPRSFELRGESLPTSGAGKVLKAELRAQHWEGHGRHVG